METWCTSGMDRARVMQSIKRDRKLEKKKHVESRQARKKQEETNINKEGVIYLSGGFKVTFCLLTLFTIDQNCMSIFKCVLRKINISDAKRMNFSVTTCTNYFKFGQNV